MSELDWYADIREVFPDWQTDEAAKRWPAIRTTLHIGQTVTGQVVARAPFGVWIDIGVNQPALLLVVNMEGAGHRLIQFDHYPAIGAKLTTRIKSLGHAGEIGLTQQNPDEMTEGKQIQQRHKAPEPPAGA